MTVEKLPVRFKRRRTITAAQIWAQPEPTDRMVWEVCVYSQGPGGDLNCQGCPEWQDDDSTRGPYKAGCRFWAEEACRTAMAVLREEATEVAEELREHRLDKAGEQNAEGDPPDSED